MEERTHVAGAVLFVARTCLTSPHFIAVPTAIAFSHVHARDDTRPSLNKIPWVHGLFKQYGEWRAFALWEATRRVNRWLASAVCVAEEKFTASTYPDDLVCVAGPTRHHTPTPFRHPPPKFCCPLRSSARAHFLNSRPLNVGLVLVTRRCLLTISTLPHLTTYTYYGFATPCTTHTARSRFRDDGHLMQIRWTVP